MMRPAKLGTQTLITDKPYHHVKTPEDEPRLFYHSDPRSFILKHSLSSPGYLTLLTS
jgi:hypothetical protein